MASTKLEEFLKRHPEVKSQVQEVGQQLKEKGAALKQDPYGPQTPPPLGASRPFASTPEVNKNLLPGTQQENALQRAMNAPKEQPRSNDRDMENER